MAVNINLKQIFPADNPTDLANKLNFNFNQLIALGFGEPGDTGAKGDTGAPGPIGQRGLTGAPGSKIWSADGTFTVDLGGLSPVDSVIGDYYISSSAIYKKEMDGTVWNLISDFDALFRSIALDSQPWATGINSEGAPPRIIVPVQNSTYLDRITDPFLVEDYVNNPPNWRLNTATKQNAQGVMFDFDVKTARKIESSGAGLNNYTVQISPSRLGSDVSLLNEAFPYTSILSLYSFYASADAATEADQFVDTTGYRHQLELGSVDDLPDYLHTTDPLMKYVISPTYQNLRVRKYRLNSIDLPGNSVVITDFNLNSQDSTSSPALNSKMTWAVNKKVTAPAGNNSTVRMSLTSSTLEGSATSAVRFSGILLDGLHFVFNDFSGPSYKFAIGFDPFNALNGTKNAMVRSDAGSSIDSIVFYAIPVIAKVGAIQVSLTSTGLVGGTGANVGIYAADTTTEIILGSSDSSFAIKIKDNRLSTAIPFPVSTGALPTANSTDANTLDEYQERTFVPTVSYGTLSTPDSGVLTNNAPSISDQGGVFVKIGKTVNFTIRFKIKDWTVVTTTGRVAPPYFSDPYTANLTPLSVGNISTDGGWTGMQHEIGAEINQLILRDIPDMWPSMVTKDNLHFAVSINPTLADGYLLRSWPMTYDWTGTNNPSSSAWEPIDPSSVYAKFGTYESGVTLPQLEFYGRRQNKTTGRTSWLESKLSIYDFLNYVHPTEALGNEIEVVVTGSYITDHQTANDVYPIGVTTTTSSTTTTTTIFGMTTTTTTAATTTTTSTTAAPTTTTTSTTGTPTYGPELVLNSDSPYADSVSDWKDSNSDGLADSWRTDGAYEVYSITSGNGFSGRAQRTTRQALQRGGIAIASNDFGIANAGSKTYELTFKYRSSHQLTIARLSSSRDPWGPYLVDKAPTNTGNATTFTATITGNNIGFKGLGFYVADDGNAGSTIWFELDVVSCREKF